MELKRKTCSYRVLVVDSLRMRIAKEIPNPINSSVELQREQREWGFLDERDKYFCFYLVFWTF
jgi:hypothetical protein